MRFAIYVLLMLAYNIGLFAYIRNGFVYQYTPMKSLLIAMIALITGNLLILYMVILRHRNDIFYSDFSEILKRYYTGDNYEEAFKKAMKDWKGGRDFPD